MTKKDKTETGNPEVNTETIIAEDTPSIPAKPPVLSPPTKFREPNPNIATGRKTLFDHERRITELENRVYGPLKV